MALSSGDHRDKRKSSPTPKYKPKPAITSPSGGARPRAGITGITATPKAGGSNRPRSNNNGSNRGGGGGAPAPRYNGGGSNGVGSNSSGFIAPKPTPPPAPPTLEAFLGTDSTYMQQQAALAKAKTDYLAQQGQSKTQYETNFLGDMDTLGKNREQSLGDLENDYASRGLLQSGLYADSMSDMTNDYGKRTSALEQAKAAFMSQQGSDLTNFMSEQGLTMTKAQQEAAARRAAKYGV